MKKKNNHVNLMLGTALLAVVTLAAAILIITNMPETPVAPIVGAPIVSGSPVATTKSPVVTKRPTNQVQPTDADITRRENQVYNDSNFTLSKNGKAHVTDFLSKIGLPELLTLKPFGGTQDITKTLCEKLYAKYNAKHFAVKISAEQCAWNLAKDNSNYVANAGSPLYADIAELDGKYLLLLVEEEGLGGTPFFTYAYNIQTGQVVSIDRSKLISTIFYYLNGKLYLYWEEEGPLHMAAIYDLATQKMVLK